MRSDNGIKVILSTPMDENDILEALEVKQLFDSAPKIPRIASDHHWECDANGLTRFRTAPTRSLTFELIDLENESSVQDPAAEPLPDLGGIEAKDESSTTLSEVGLVHLNILFENYGNLFVCFLKLPTLDPGYRSSARGDSCSAFHHSLSHRNNC